MDGVIVINKPQSITSHDVVRSLRKILNTKQIGHTGTLDPMATGVLPILIGKSTKISKYLIEHDKTYIATLKLGIKTDTGDITGNIIEENSKIKIDVQMVEEILKTFIGKQQQTPPMYSAIKVNGKKLYEYARAGEKVTILPRNIEIYNIQLDSIKDDEIKFEVNCSKGTYIRVLCEDIAKRLNTIGTMSSLQRTKVDKFSIEDATTLEEIADGKVKIILPEEIFKDKKKVTLNIQQIEKFLNGVMIQTELEDEVVCVYNDKNEFFALATVVNHKLKRDIVFNE